jgi:hypothetical protein
MNRTVAALLLFTTALALSACGPADPYDREGVERLRARAEALIAAQTLMGYNSWVHGAASAQDSLYREADDLFSDASLALVRKAEAAEQDSVQRRRLWMLRRYLTTELLTKRAARLTDSISNIEATAVLTLDGRSFPYRRLPSLLANERSPERRAALYAAADSLLGVLHELHRTVIAGYRRDAAALGYPSYIAMAEELKEFSLRDMAAQAESLLVSTEEDYTGLVGALVPARLGIPAAELRRSDVPALLRSPEFDAAFTAGAMMDRLRTTWRGMGIDLDTLRTLRIDTEDRPSKNPRAACFAVNVPNDVRLSIKPVGGFQDYCALFHEMGHALHYAYTREHAVEFRYMGEYSVTETYAFLSEYLLVNPAWMRMRSGMSTDVLKDFARAQAFVRLYMVRRYAAKVLYELALYDGQPRPDSVYAALQGRAAGITPLPSDRLRSLTDIDPLFYSATYFRAWLLEAQLSRHLSRTYGLNWFENPGAGVFLRELWAGGDRLTAPDLSRAAGEGLITPEALLDQVQLLLVLSSKPAATK